MERMRAFQREVRLPRLRGEPGAAVRRTRAVAEIDRRREDGELRRVDEDGLLDFDDVLSGDFRPRWIHG